LDYGLREEYLKKLVISRNPKQNSATLWRIFSSFKSAPAIRKKRFSTNRDPNNQEVGGFFVFGGSEL
jgi:hypothetical protein